MSMTVRDSIGRVAPRLPWLALAGTMAAAVAYLVPGGCESLSYELAKPHSWGRGLTGHWVHWNAEHLLWSAAAFALLGGLCELRSRKAFVMCVIACSAAVPLALRISPPSFSEYGGLSGLDFGLYMLLSASLLREAAQERHWPRALLATLLIVMGIGKVAFEMATGQVLFVSDMANLVPAPMAHATAGIVGLLCAGPTPRRTRSGCCAALLPDQAKCQTLEDLRRPADPSSRDFGAVGGPGGEGINGVSNHLLHSCQGSDLKSALR